jgi:N-acetylmuramoyl-L-alanine amidase
MPHLPSSQLQIDTIDTTALRGKVIVIDSGHGGKYRGAIGKMGLRESEVNLGVALYLWGFLYHAGANPVMTRTADATVAFPLHTRLGEDLRARSKLSNSLNPDLFISIHHNSNTNDLKKNTLEVYYKLMDPGPSRELAECIMEKIKNTFEVEKARVLPGNYSVLRNTKSTAILGEASYLTHKHNERRLSLHGFLRLEAEAYFLGILDYFQKGVPRILALIPNGDFLYQAQPEIAGWVKDDEWGKGIDPDSIKLYLDGILVEHSYALSTGKVSYTPTRPLTNKIHTLSMEAKNFGGNSAKLVSTVFYTSLPPFQIKSYPLIDTLPPDGVARTSIISEIVDENLNPVADGTLVKFTTSSGKIVDSLVATKRGKAITHLVADYQPGRAEVMATCDRMVSTCTVTFDKPERELIEICVYDRQGSPLKGAELRLEEERYCLTDPLGCCFYQQDSDEPLEFTMWKDGYLPLRGFLDLRQEGSVQEKLVLEPIDHGLMWNKVVVLDPQPVHEAAALKSSREITRDEFNLQTAFYLREMLKLAGATVFLTREGDTAPSPIERVLVANGVEADVLISLDHREGSSYLKYYYNSPRGKLIAHYFTESINEELSCKKMRMIKSNEFVLVHTGMPAVVINLDRRKCKKLPEDRENSAWTEAKALYQGLRSYFKLNQ